MPGTTFGSARALAGRAARGLRDAGRRLALVAASAAALGACNVALPRGDVSGVGRVGDGPVQVALLVPYGSARGSDTTVARSLENAARLGIADLGSDAVTLTVYPTQGIAGGAQNAAAQAVAAGAQVILGPLYGDNAAAAGVAAAGSGVPVLSFSNNATVAGGNVWVLGNTFENTARRILSFAAQQGRGRVLLTHASTPAGQIAGDAVRSAAPGTGAQITGTVVYPLSQAGIAGAVPDISAQVTSSGATSVFLTGDAAGDLPVISQLLTEAGVTVPNVAFLGLSSWNVPADALNLPSLQGGYFALPDPNLASRFRQRYAAAYGDAPHPLAGLAYDGIAAIGAITRSGRPVGRATLTDRSGFAGTGGVFRLRADGTNDRALAVARVVDRQAQVVSPAPNTFRGAGS